MRPKKSARSKKTRGASAVGSWTLSLAVCVVAAAVLIAARQPSPSAEITHANPEAMVPAPVVRAQARTTPAAVPAPAAATEPEPAATTITGCLERDDQIFRLNDTAGAAVPTSRSWKSGFLKKAPASIAVVDAANRLNLANHVGRRVSVSGTRVDREMRARSLRRIDGACD